MAADPRQFTEHNTVGGANVYLEDKRMEELKSATAKTSSQVSTSAQYVPLQDTDGNLVKINMESFQEAVRNVLGGLLANNDKGTTISGVPALSGSGASLDFGSITPANLASVLGVNSNFKEVFADAGKILKIHLGSTYYSGIATLRGGNTQLWAHLMLSGYGADASRNAVSIIGRGNIVKVYLDTNERTTWYLQSTNSGLAFTFYYLKLGGSFTSTLIDSLPATATEVTT